MSDTNTIQKLKERISELERKVEKLIDILIQEFNFVDIDMPIALKQLKEEK